VAGDNLTITFGADASKLNSELKFVQQNLKQLDREIAKAFKAGNIAQARQLSDTYGTMKTRADGLNSSLKGTAGALDQVTAAGRRTETQFRRISLTASGIGRLAASFGGGAVGGFVSQATIAGLREVQQLLDSQIERITKIRDLARETAQNPAAVAASQNIARAAGESTDAIDTAMKTQAEAFSKQIQRQRAALGATTPEQQAKQKELQDARARLLGGGPIVGGDKQAALDLANAYEILTVNTKKYKDTQDDLARFQNDIDKMFLKIANSGRLGNTQINELSKALYGVNAATMQAILPDKIAKFATEAAKVAPPLKAAEEATKGLAKSQGDLENQFNETANSATIGYAKARTAINKELTQLLKGTWTDALAEVGKLQNDAIGSLVKSLSGALKGRPEGMPDPADQIQGEFKDLPNFFQGIGKTISDVWSATFGSIIGSAQAAEVRVSASAKGMSASFVVAAKDIQNAMAAALGAVNSLQGAASMAQGAAALPRSGSSSPFGVDVFRGGIGDQGGHGPASFATQSVTPGLSDYQAPLPHVVYPSSSFAAGGMIHGPGSGTSDSILARLSNGEFVMRAAAVRNLGAGFLSTLNRFAGGGMVMPSRGIPSFANGGIVAAGAGTGRAVHLHLGGHEFALSGAGGVVDALVTEASRQRMRSGGLKPSWYGGRVSG
jgi:hypothetical protein